MSTIVFAYHGTSGSAVERIEAEGFVASANPYDWLGDGTYFFQDIIGFPTEAIDIARGWARSHHPGDPAVLSVRIELLDCIDLLDAGWASRLREVHDVLAARARSIGRSLPKKLSQYLP
jgi:hypothetical protein